jgi:hypothetical protein
MWEREEKEYLAQRRKGRQVRKDVFTTKGTKSTKFGDLMIGTLRVLLRGEENTRA